MLALPCLADIARSIDPAVDPSTKPGILWSLYEQYMPPYRHQPVRMLELGVHKGVSAKVFSRYFTFGTIVAVDTALPEFDVAAFPNVHLVQCDQRDTARLHEICNEFAPDGFDIVIDDASHIGVFSLSSYHALFPRVRSGGLYVIEDWTTAYRPTDRWGDGAERKPIRFAGYDGVLHTRIKSHDYGMAGFVKALIDDMPFGVPKVIKKMVVHDLLVVLEKA